MCASIALAGAFFAVGVETTQTAVANGDTRSLSFYHTHSHERISVTFKKDGKYDQGALKKLNHFLRDWRNQKETEMEPRLFDVIWEVQKDAGSTAPIHIVSAYRPPETNEKLRSRSKGVAKNSQHTLGRAMDIHLPDVNMSKIREAGLRLQRGGVGFYPTSAKPFVHLDVGSVRHWPRMTRDQLVRLFPDGRTVHLPTDGVPLKNYNLAMADVIKNGGVVRGMSETQIAMAQRNQDKAGKVRGSGFLAKFLGGDDEDDAPATAAPDVTTPAPAQAPVALAAIEEAVPMPEPRPMEAGMIGGSGPQLATAYAPQQLPSGPELIWRTGADPVAGRAAATTSPDANTTTPPALVAHAAPQVATINPESIAPVTASLAPNASMADQRAAALELLSQLREPPPVEPEAQRASRVATAFDSFAPQQTAAIPQQEREAPQQVAVASTADYTTPSSSFSPRRTARNRELSLNHPNFEGTSLIATPVAVLPSSFGGNPNSGMRSDLFVGNSIPVLRTVSYGPQRTAELLKPRT